MTKCKSMVVVILVVVRNLSRIRPDVVDKVGVRVVNPRVDHRNAVRGVARPDVPCFHRSDIRPGRARIAVYRLSFVVESPQ